MDTLAREIKARIAALPKASTADLRRVRKDFSKKIEDLNGKDVIALAKLLIRQHRVPHFVAYELIQHHKKAAPELNAKVLQDLAQDLESWWTVDAFACYLSGVAWREGRVSDKFIYAWARCENVWIRRAALVSTVALNNKARGGTGDAEKTLAVCELLIADREDMIVKALSWALRELAKRDPEAVKNFVKDNEEKLAARVKREVRTKLETGLKNKRR
jgi:3-methyladenine DNA glycosylase AlkD